MHVIDVRNVSEALPAGVDYLLSKGVREDSRNGPVIVAPGPVTTVYRRPTERVLLSPVRDHNPFFAIGESLWMLAGRNDGEFLNLFIRDFTDRFSEVDSPKPGVIHDAYGHRWREALDFDQLDFIVELLRKDPTTRQAVLQMWDARGGRTRYNFSHGEIVVEQGSDDLRGTWRARPCNTHAYFRLRREPGSSGSVLDLTVCCRSNDIIWGAYGANAVHFSVLQEYVAARVGCEVGVYCQVSNNYHAYVAELDRLRERAQKRGFSSLPDALQDTSGGRWSPTPLVDDPTTFDDECRTLVSWTGALGHGDNFGPTTYVNRFLGETAEPMLRAALLWREDKIDEARSIGLTTADPGWRQACCDWIERRVAAREQKRSAAR